jgi:DNA (cytosine-5)-methyltransferase 1
VICVVGTGGRRINRRKDDHGGAVNFPTNVTQAQAVMGIDWMGRKELSQAIPPAYTEYIGSQLRCYIRSRT